MRQGVARQRHADEILLRRFDALLDGQRHFAGFATAEADDAVLIADDDQRRERQVLAALDHFGHAVDRNYLVFQIET